MSSDHYVVLGVGRDATAEDIKISFRRLIRQHHPDLVEGGEEASALINAAYEELGVAERRVAYDRVLAEEFVVEPGPEAGGWGVTDDSWLDVETDVDESFIEAEGGVTGSRTRLWWTLAGWLLILLGGVAAATPWTLGNGVTPSAAAGVVLPVMVLAVISASGLRGYALANGLWRAALEVRAAAGGWLAGLIQRLVVLLIAGAVWLLLSSIGFLAAGLTVAFGLWGGFIELGALSSSGLVLGASGGLVARCARLWRRH